MNMFLLHTVKCFKVLLCITNNSIKLQSFVYTQLNNQTVLFLTIQFGMSFVCTQFKCQTCSIWPIDRTLSGATTPTWVDLGAMAMKGYSTFPKAKTLPEPRHLTVSYCRHLFGGMSYSSVEMKPVCSMAPADWAMSLKESQSTTSPWL